MNRLAYPTSSPASLLTATVLGVLLASTCVRGGQDQILQYHGNGWVKLPDGVTPTENVTIEMWARADETGPEEIYRMYSWGPRVGCNPSTQYLAALDAVWARPGFRAHFWVGCAQASALNALDETQAGAWQHIAVAIQANGLGTLYVNGLEQESGFYRGGQSVGDGDDLLGAYWSGNDFLPSSAGALNEVRVWDHVRSQEEIQETMNETLTGNEDGLIAYWNFDDGTADDVTPNGFDGVIMGDAEIVPIGGDAGCDPQEVQKLLASDGTSGDKFGSQVWVDGDWAIIGAQLDDEAGTQAGSAYIFRRANGAWVEEAKLIASDAAAIDRFGRWVAMDGDRAVIGASLHDDGGSNTGAVYVFTREGDDWIEQAKLTASDAMPGDQLGGGVAIQGDWIVAGASQNSVNGGSGPGKVYLFHLDDNDTWVEAAQLAASDGAFNDIFGFDLGIQDDVIVVAAPQANPAGSDSGAVYVYRLVEDEWIEEQKLVPTTAIAGDQFGRHVSISGDRIAGGALGGTGRAFVFRYEDDEWIEEAQLTGSNVSAGDSFGNTLSLDGNQLLVSAFTHDEAGSGSGSAYLFLLDDNGTPDDPNDDSWMEAAELIASDGAAGDNFGTDVSVSGTTAFITAQEDDDAGSSSGSAYVFELCGPDSEEAALLSFNVLMGKLVAGDLQSLEESDDDSVEIDAELVDLVQPVYLSNTLIRATSPATTVSRLDLTLETGVDTEPVLTRVLLRNFETGDWDLLDGFRQSEPDSEATFLEVPNPNAYVHDAHGQIAVRIETRANAAQVPDGYVFRIDHVQLAVTTGEGGGIAGGGNALPCDLDGDGIVGASDLVLLLGMWGECGNCDTCQPDFNTDCVVDANDLLILLGNWAENPSPAGREVGGEGSSH